MIDSPKMSDIAKLARVSEMTVSRALRGIEGVSLQKRADILRIARDIGYVPNFNARSLANASSNIVGISFPTLYNDVFVTILEGIQKTLETSGITTVVNTTYYDSQKEMDWIQKLLSWRPVGLVLTGVNHDKKISTILKASNVPCVEAWDITDTPISSSVGIDHFEAGREIATYAIERGYRRPAIVKLPHGYDKRLDKRIAGIKHCFSHVDGSNVLIESIQDDENSFTQGFKGTKYLLEHHPQTDVIFYVNDHVAFGGVAACNALALNIPQDIGLIGFNGLDIGAALPKSLTTAFTPRYDIGVQAARNLVASLHGVTPPPVTKLKITMKPGGTTR